MIRLRRRTSCDAVCSPASPAAISGARHDSAGSGAGRLLVYRRLVDLLDRRLELGVELLVSLVFGQPFEKRAREAGDEGGIAGEPGAGLVTAVAARQSDDPEDARVRRQVAVQARPGRDGAPRPAFGSTWSSTAAATSGRPAPPA